MIDPEAAAFVNTWNRKQWVWDVNDRVWGKTAAVRDKRGPTELQLVEKKEDMISSKSTSDINDGDMQRFFGKKCRSGLIKKKELQI